MSDSDLCDELEGLGFEIESQTVQQYQFEPPAVRSSSSQEIDEAKNSSESSDEDTVKDIGRG